MPPGPRDYSRIDCQGQGHRILFPQNCTLLRRISCAHRHCYHLSERGPWWHPGLYILRFGTSLFRLLPTAKGQEDPLSPTAAPDVPRDVQCMGLSFGALCRCLRWYDGAGYRDAGRDCGGGTAPPRTPDHFREADTSYSLCRSQCGFFRAVSC